MKFFTDCKDKEEAKATFRELAQLFHPDHGGNAPLFMDLKRQYDYFIKNGPLISFGGRAGRVFKQDIPFDHPIHYRIKQLEDQIKYLKNSLDVCHNIKNEYLDKYVESCEKINSLQMKLNELNVIIHMINAPKTFLDHLKAWWYAK